jgi:hypothetical protein
MGFGKDQVAEVDALFSEWDRDNVRVHGSDPLLRRRCGRAASAHRAAIVRCCR